MASYAASKNFVGLKGRLTGDGQKRTNRKTRADKSRIRKKQVGAELLITEVLFGTHMPGSDGEGEEIAVFFQSVRQGETVIDNDILRG